MNEPDAVPDPTRHDPPPPAVREAVARALAEDLLPLGDLTAALVPATSRVALDVVSRSPGVLAGRACVDEVVRQLDPGIQVRWECWDGSTLVPGVVVARLDGPLRSILTAERTMLNFLCHLSGVATATRELVTVVREANPDTRVLDTRKTTPGLRSLEKAAVRAGGGVNHRGGLSDAVLVKDNHLGGMTIAEAVGRARSLWPGRMVEVECDRPDQVNEAIAAGATVVMLDNMTPAQVEACVPIVHAAGILVEVSGGITLASAARYAAAGADLLSVGALTHSAPILDLGLDLAGARES